MKSIAIHMISMHFRPCIAGSENRTENETVSDRAPSRFLLIGRRRGLDALNRLYESGHAEPAAIYGRDGVGKTCLADENFSGSITFRHAGLSSESTVGKEAAVSV